MSTEPLLLGKLPPALLREVLEAGPRLPPEVRVGPAVGEDACAIDVDACALVAATDPITMVGSGVGAHAVVVNANDVAVMGARPRWFLASVLLPAGTTADDVRSLFAGMREALAGAGAALVGGHSEVTAAVTQPVVVGQMLGVCERSAVVRTGGLRPGDRILQVGRAPVEGAAVLAGELSGGARAAAAARLEAGVLERAARALEEPGISVVEPALLAAGLGATALHDPTEGGLSAGLHELAEASGLSLQLEGEEALWFGPGLELCRSVGADPWGTLASGALLAGFPAEAAASAARALAAAGHEVAVVAHAVRGSAGRVRRADGRPLARFERDELSRVLGGA